MAGSDFPVELIWDVLWKTAFVLVILYGVLWAIRRFSGSPLIARKGPSISVVETAHLGPGRSVHLVGVGNKLLLLGTTSQQISLLAELAPADLDRPVDELHSNRCFDRYLNQARDLAASVSTRIRSMDHTVISRDSDKSEAGK